MALTKQAQGAGQAVVALVIDFCVGLQFLTRIKIVTQQDWTPDDFGRSVKFFPLVGLVIGAALAGLYLLARPWLPPHVLAALLLVGEIAATGGLHLDGFMDTMDGIFSGRTPARMLAIMKDSRVGANGVTGLAALLLCKWSLLLDMPPAHLLVALLCMPAISRWVQVVAITMFPYARPAGMGKAFACHAGRRALLIASILTAAVLWPLGWRAYAAAAVSLAVGWLALRFVQGKIGGLTGDVYGAVTELSEIIVLVVWLMSANLSWPML